MSQPASCGYVAPGTNYVNGNLFNNGNMLALTAFGLITLTIAVSVAAVPRIVLDSTGTQIDLNEGVPLTSDKLYILQWFQDQRDPFNIRLSASCTIRIAGLTIQ